LPKGTNVIVGFIAGYNVDEYNAALVPMDLWAAILIWVCDKYENREITGTNTSELPNGFEALIKLHGLSTV
jgi:hypothetical protein